MSVCIYPARFLIPSLVHLHCCSISKAWISVQNAQMKIKKILSCDNLMNISAQSHHQTMKTMKKAWTLQSPFSEPSRQDSTWRI